MNVKLLDFDIIIRFYLTLFCVNDIIIYGKINRGVGSMKKVFRTIWIIIALAVFVAGLIYVILNWGWKSWVIWGAASAVMSIGTFLLDFFSRFRGCLGTIIFIVLSVVLGPLHLLFAIISTVIAIKKDS